MPNTQANTVQPVPAPRKRRWGVRFAVFFALTTGVLAYSTYWLATDDRQQHRNVQQSHAELQAEQGKAANDEANLRAVADLVAAPDTASITLQQQPGEPPGQAHVLYNARLELAVYSGQISPAPGGKSYQLWVMTASGAPISAGIISANQQTGAVVVHLEQGISAKAFAVTVEPAGGVPQPTGPKVLVGAVNS